MQKFFKFWLCLSQAWLQQYVLTCYMQYTYPVLR